MDTLVTNRDLLKFSVNSSMYRNSFLRNKLTLVLLPHLDLTSSSTTVTWIKMKEEQNTSSCVNYDEKFSQRLS